MSGHPSFRQLPEDDIETVKNMTLSGIPQRQIISSLCQKNLNLLVNSRTIYNFKTKLHKNGLGNRPLVSKLFEDLEKGGFSYDVFHDPNSPLSIKLARIFSNVFVMDYTYKTNKYKMPLHDIIRVSCFVVTGRKVTNITNQQQNNIRRDKSNASELKEDVVELSSGNYVVNTNETHYVMIGKVKDSFDFSWLRIRLTFLGLWMMCKNEGFMILTVDILGGLWMLIKFGMVKAFVNFKNNSVVKQWFSETQNWDRNFVPKERLVWLDVEGELVRVWRKSFRKILAKWGEVVEMKDELGENVFSNREVVGWNLTFAPEATPSKSGEEVESKDGIYDDGGNSPQYYDGDDDGLLDTNHNILKDDDNTEADVCDDVNQHTKGGLRPSTPDAGIVRLEHHDETVLVRTTSATTTHEAAPTFVIDKAMGGLLTGDINETRDSLSKGDSFSNECDVTIQMGTLLGFNMEGWSGDKRAWIRDLCSKHRVSFLGVSGGILAVWDRHSFTRHCVDDNFLAVEVTWRPKDIILTIVTVYAPQKLAAKKRL
nr:protein FAR1-related sequence 5-like [Tanacetum cinerariifolium]